MEEQLADGAADADPDAVQPLEICDAITHRRIGRSTGRGAGRFVWRSRGARSGGGWVAGRHEIAATGPARFGRQRSSMSRSGRRRDRTRGTRGARPRAGAGSGSQVGVVGDDARSVSLKSEWSLRFAEPSDQPTVIDYRDLGVHVERVGVRRGASGSWPANGPAPSSASTSSASGPRVSSLPVRPARKHDHDPERRVGRSRSFAARSSTISGDHRYCDSR